MPSLDRGIQNHGNGVYGNGLVQPLQPANPAAAGYSYPTAAGADGGAAAGGAGGGAAASQQPSSYDFGTGGEW